MLHSSLEELLQDLRQLAELNQRQSRRIVQLRARLAAALDVLREHDLLEEFERRIRKASRDDG